MKVFLNKKVKVVEKVKVFLSRKVKVFLLGKVKVFLSRKVKVFLIEKVKVSPELLHVEVELLVCHRRQRPDILIKVDHQLRMMMIDYGGGSGGDYGSEGVGGDDDIEDKVYDEGQTCR